MIATANYGEYAEILTSHQGRYFALAEVDWDRNRCTVLALDSFTGKSLLRRRILLPAGHKIQDAFLTWVGPRRVKADVSVEGRNPIIRRYSF